MRCGILITGDPGQEAVTAAVIVVVVLSHPHSGYGSVACNVRPAQVYISENSLCVAFCNCIFSKMHCTGCLKKIVSRLTKY